MKLFVFVLFFYTSYSVEVNALDPEENDLTEARGKGKYALLTHLAILLAAKVGLYKIFLGIAFVVAAIKAMVVMAWALAISKHVPDVWSHYKNTHPNYMHFFYVAATKIFVLKIIYGIIFYVIVTKAWHFILWLVHYLKEKKHEHHVELDHEPEIDYHHHNHGYGSYGTLGHGSYGGHDSFGHESYGSHDSFGYESYGSHDSFGHGNLASHDSFGGYGPYSAYDKPSYGLKKKIYDADGSYSAVIS